MCTNRLPAAVKASLGTKGNPMENWWLTAAAGRCVLQRTAKAPGWDSLWHHGGERSAVEAVEYAAV
jgi:hypothetical protein